MPQSVSSGKGASTPSKRAAARGGRSTARGRHPRGLSVLFFAELWERFSFYGMRALLSLYMNKQLGYTKARAQHVYHAYGALVYGLPVIGGRLADAPLGHQSAVLFGGVLLALGHFCMAVQSEAFFYAALALIATGVGLFKASVSSLVGTLYDAGDPRRDAGFTLFYMGINLGAMVAPLVCGALRGFRGNRGWHLAFAAAGIGMLLGLGWFLRGRHTLAGRGSPPSPERLHAPTRIGLSRLQLIILGVVGAVPLCGLILWKTRASDLFLYAVGAVAVGFLIRAALCNPQPAIRHRLWLVLILMLFHTAFWAVVEQAGSSFTFLTEHFVDRRLLGLEINTEHFQAANPLFIIAFAPITARLWTRLSDSRTLPSMPVKFAMGLALAGLGFAVLAGGASLTLNAWPESGSPGPVPRISPLWLLLAYLCHALGELWLSPIGLSAVTKLAPPGMVGAVMGTWFLTFSLAHKGAALIAALTVAGGSPEIPASNALQRYITVYSGGAAGAVALAILLVLISRPLNRLAHGVR